MFGWNSTHLFMGAGIAALVTAVICVPATVAFVGGQGRAAAQPVETGKPAGACVAPEQDQGQSSRVAGLEKESATLRQSKADLDAQWKALQSRVGKLQAALAAAGKTPAGDPAANAASETKTYGSLDEAFSDIDWQDMAASLLNRGDAGYYTPEYVTFIAKNMPAWLDAARRLGVSDFDKLFEHELVLQKLLPAAFAAMGKPLSAAQVAKLDELIARTNAARQNLDKAALPGLEFRLMSVAFAEGLRGICGKEGLDALDGIEVSQLAPPEWAGDAAAKTRLLYIQKGAASDDTRRSVESSLMAEYCGKLTETQKAMAQPIMQELAGQVIAQGFNMDGPAGWNDYKKANANVVNAHIQAIGKMMLAVPMTEEQKAEIRKNGSLMMVMVFDGK